MLLKSIKLNNIRSYLNEKIEFSGGSTLLSGDIGSGKSTVLLAIEFALFGSKPSELPASSLLRHGKREGYVEVSLDINGKNVLIRRNLKRTKQGIKQETGFIVYSDSKKDLSPVEMKSEIFELLGYPKDLVSKGKDLIYRYTVYTPQEEMKRIILENKDLRLDTLRKVFNIDKYKRIKENGVILMRSLKEKRKEIEGYISDLDEKSREREFLEKEISSLDKKIGDLIPKVELIKDDVEKKKERVNYFEDRIKELNRLKNRLEVIENNSKNLLDEREKNNKSLSMQKTSISAIEKELKSEKIVDSEKIKEDLGSIEGDIEKLRKDRDDINTKLSDLRVGKNKSEDIISKIMKLEKCPLCLQNVEHDHKDSISEREKRKIKEAEKKIKSYYEQEEKLRNELTSLEKKREVLRKAENKMEIIKLKKHNLKERNDEIIRIKEVQQGIKRKIEDINREKDDLNKKVESMKNIEKKHAEQKLILDKALEKEKKLNIEKTGLEKEMEYLNRLLKSLEQEITKKFDAKAKLVYFVKLQNWLEELFINLMIAMEKHVMLKVQKEFNELFMKWFNSLIEDENISVRMDDEFTPVIEQNGYETNLENLSGGERTSVALAYRLALNKVINDVVSDIKTRDILMLDEPTDGFSAEQLDRARDVLNQLNLIQTILVSHETKIESFVDRVIRIEKQEHVSSVV